MIIYVVFFLILALLSIVNYKIEKSLKDYLLFTLFIILLIFIGFRDEVGGDWDTYKGDFSSYIQYFDITTLSYKRDFGYELVSYVLYHLGFSIYSLNLFCAFIFVYALFALGKEYNNYLIILLIAFPFFIIIGAMGYIKQSTAFGFIILSFISLKKDFYLRFLIYSFLAIIFHKSSFPIAIILIISKFRFDFKSLFILFIISLFSYLILSVDKSRILSYFITDSYKSEGVYYRLFINLVAGAIFIFFHKKLHFNSFEKKFISINILLTILGLYYASNYSTIVDRFLIYSSLIQLLIYPKFINLNNNFSMKIFLGSSIFYLLILIGWFTFSNFSLKWIPYNNLLFPGL
tara:strand:+ start:269 stop:1309 length:1041 start_codon:yes stop_codon:yes gene_type:complete